MTKYNESFCIQALLAAKGSIWVRVFLIRITTLESSLVCRFMPAVLKWSLIMRLLQKKNVKNICMQFMIRKLFLDK